MVCTKVYISFSDHERSVVTEMTRSTTAVHVLVVFIPDIPSPVETRENGPISLTDI